MSKKDQLRLQRAGTIINRTSSQQEKDVIVALRQVVEVIQQNYKLDFDWRSQLHLGNVIVDMIRKGYQEELFGAMLPQSSMRPDGGILSIKAHDGNLYPILITEVKNQGTNDLRIQEGKSEQSMGNAIERLGKNVIGFRTWLITENIFPFVCFGYGWDFQDGSYILDRVKTINMFGPLNTFAVERQGPNKEFQRGCFYFRQEKWSIPEMFERMRAVACFSIEYYLRSYPDKF